MARADAVGRTQVLQVPLVPARARDRAWVVPLSQTVYLGWSWSVWQSPHVSLLSADVAVAVVRPEVISQRVFISRGRTRARWKALVTAHTIVQ